MKISERTDVVFVHVPKCAGSSVVATLRECRLRPMPISWGQIDSSYQQYMKTNQPSNFVSGHLRDRHLAALEASGKDYFLFTFLRHPVDRLISVYRYNASPASPNYSGFVRTYPDFEDWAMQYPANDMASFIAGAVETAEAYAEKVLSRFHFIGFQESYFEDMMTLLPMLGMPKQSNMRENVTMKTFHNTFTVDDDLRARIEARNALDCEAFYLIRQKIKT